LNRHNESMLQPIWQAAAKRRMAETSWEGPL
jgi:hypothetical protein